MGEVAVRIFHPDGTDVGPLERLLVDARARNVVRLERGFREAGARDVRVLTEPGSAARFGVLLRAAASEVSPAGLIVLGSGSIPLATARDVGDLVAAAGSAEPWAMTNNRFSSDVLSVSRSEVLRRVPELHGDNALPRWLTEVAGIPVADLGRRWHLGFDLDSPIDAVLAGDRPPEASAVRERIAAVLDVARNRGAEIVVAGRTSAATLAWLERHTASRTRALVEERGLRTRSARQRAPRSVLGLVLDRDGPAALGTRLAELADGALVDTRVLLAHRLGSDEANWPGREDRYGSDLLLPDRIADPWLAELTAAALAAPIPVLLGGHTLVGPGIRLMLGGRG